MQDALNPPELAEARKIIGAPLIERNEELIQEIETLLQILREYTFDIENKRKAQEWQSRLARDLRKDKLEAEIRTFICELRSRTTNPISLRPKTAREQTVISCFVTAERPQTARELLQARRASRPSSEGDDSKTITSIRDKVEQGRPKTADLVSRALAEKGDILAVCEKLECIANSLREELAMEYKVLLDDVAFLHACFEIEFEREALTEPHLRAPPTEEELLELKSKLQVRIIGFPAFLDVVVPLLLNPNV